MNDEILPCSDGYRRLQKVSAVALKNAGTFAMVLVSVAEMKWFTMLPLLWSIVSAGPLHAQPTMQSPPDWQKAAGGGIAFEVASVREHKGPFKPPSFALSSDEWFRVPNGRFHADFALPTYIEFAYKIWLTGEERSAILAKLPE